MAPSKISKIPVTKRRWVTAALALSMFMTAIEITIVATVMPQIVSDLEGFSLMSWVFSAYLLTQVVSIPIYGKLADLYGRKPIFLGGIFVFLIASFLCGQAESMVQLIAFRFLQGLGGGAVQPIGVTIVGDLFAPQERHKIQGLIGSIFAFSSLVGPTLGAFLVEFAHWSWIFYINIPLGIFASILIWIFLHEDTQPRKHKIDFGGAALLIVATSILMLALLEGGTAWPWLSWQSAACLTVFILLTLVLLRHEGRVAEPILPVWVLRHRLIGIAGVATFLNGALMIGYSAMIPTYVQGVLGGTAIVAGLTLAAMSIGWPLASFFSGRIMAKIGYRKTAIAGAFSLLIGACGVYGLSETSALLIGIAVFFVGVGLGLQSNAYIITIQSTVSWGQRGVATANNLFMRTLGSSVGVAAFGGILNSEILNEFKDQNKDGFGLDMINQLLNAEGSTLSSEVQSTVVLALNEGMMAVFLSAIAVSLICVLMTFLLPNQADNTNKSLRVN